MHNDEENPGGNEEIALSVGITLGAVVTTVVAVTVCCIWWACYRRRYAHNALPNKNFDSCAFADSFDCTTEDMNCIACFIISADLNINKLYKIMICLIKHSQGK